jgi:hypothetical protein
MLPRRSTNAPRIWSARVTDGDRDEDAIGIAPEQPDVQNGVRMPHADRKRHAMCSKQPRSRFVQTSENPPLPRCSRWAYSSLKNHPSVSAFPDSTIGSARTSSFSRLARRLLTLRPAHSRSHQIRDRYPGDSDISSPPCLLRSLPAGAVAGWDCTHWKSAALFTAHVENRPLLGELQGTIEVRFDVGAESSLALARGYR